jgi:hypothetical protein
LVPDLEKLFIVDQHDRAEGLAAAKSLYQVLTTIDGYFRPSKVPTSGHLIGRQQYLLLAHMHTDGGMGDGFGRVDRFIEIRRRKISGRLGSGKFPSASFPQEHGFRELLGRLR